MTTRNALTTWCPASAECPDQIFHLTMVSGRCPTHCASEITGVNAGSAASEVVTRDRWALSTFANTASALGSDEEGT